MSLRAFIFTAVLTAAFIFRPLLAEYKFFIPQGSFTVEVSLENTDELRLPIYRNAITSLAVLGDCAIGGTSADQGLSPFLFAVSLSQKELVAALDLDEVLPGQRAIQSGFCRIGKSLYAGTIPGRENDSGHLIEVRFEKGRLAVADLGAVVEGEGVFSLTADSGRAKLYGISYPSGKFFSFDLETGLPKVFQETAITKKQRAYYHRYSLEAGDILSRSLVVDRKGRVYGSRPVNSIFRYDPDTGKLETLPDELPTVWGRRPLGRTDSWALAPDGTIYGGNSAEGQLFRIEPESGRVVNLGKPIRSARLKGMAFGADGRLYGVAGASPGYAHLFVYDPETGGYTDLGNPRFPMMIPEIGGVIPWRGFQIATLTANEDGSYILLGEEESLSQLMVFPVNSTK